MSKLALLALASTAFCLAGCTGGQNNSPAASAAPAANIKPAEAIAPAANIAIGKTYSLSPAPNYKYGKKVPNPKTDNAVLTDGRTCKDAKETPWTQESCVGWTSVTYAKIVVDLGKGESVSGVGLHAAFDGADNVKWPNHIDVFASDDGKLFRKVCDLVAPEWKDAFPQDLQPIDKQGLRIYEYRSKPLSLNARYIAFAIDGPKYAFCDEVMIYGGQAGKPDASPESALKSVEGHMEDIVRNRVVKDVLFTELAKVEANAAGIGDKAAFNALKKEIQEADIPAIPQGYRAVSPLNGLHSKIFKLNTASTRKQGAKSLVAWNCNRWAPLAATDAPAANAPTPKLDFNMMGNEFRGEALNLTNNSAEDIELEVSFAGLPGSPAPGYMEPSQVEFVFAQSQMIADPLPPLKKSSAGYLMKLPSGMTKQLWINCDTKSLGAGTYAGRVMVKGGGENMEIPLSLRVSAIRFPDKPNLSLCMWDYVACDPNGFKASTERNRRQAIEDMRRHFVDSSWTKFHEICWPDAKDFDKDGNLVAPLRTGRFDKWLEDFKGFEKLFAYTEGARLEKFAGEPYGTPRFERMVAQWAVKFAAYAKSKGVEPGRIYLLFSDEPWTETHFKINAAYAKAIAASGSGLKLFTDLDGRAEKSMKSQSPAIKEMLKPYDIVCPHLPQYADGMKEIASCVNASADKPREYWFYSCLGTARLFDPYYYHRLQAWHCWKNDAKGMGFWCYWNYYKNPDDTAWNELNNPKADTFGVVYSTADSIVSGKHWEAIREGVEDYEYLFMLKSRIAELKAKGERPEAIKKAEELLATLPSKVTGKYDRHDIRWDVPKDRDTADQARLEVLQALESLN